MTAAYALALQILAHPELMDALFVRTPKDKLIKQWCDAKDNGDLDRAQEIEFEFEELEERA